ncbi:MAG: efflux RND transporter permease subunit [Myxococcota bacterium]
MTEPEENGTVPSRGPIAWFARNTVASNIVMVVLILGGLVMLTQLKQEVFPEVEADSVIIHIAYPGASPAEVESGVTLAVEESVRGLDGVKEVRSTSQEGISVVTVVLLTGADKDRALSDVKAAVDRITSLPEDVERPVISVPTNSQQVLSVILYGDASERALKELGERVRDEMVAESDNITLTNISGVRPLEITVDVTQAALRQNDLTLGSIAGAIRASSIELPGGSVRTDGGDVLLRTAARRETGSEIEAIPLRARPDGSVLRVGDVAEVTDGFREEDREASYNGERAVMVNVYRIGDQSPIGVAEAAKLWLEENADELPPGIEAVIWNDQSKIYAARIDLLLRNAYMGLALVLLVLGLFLEPRLAFWVTLGIPISFAGSLLFLPMADVSLNMISLFAFIVTLGMVVDDAIVEVLHLIII